jgi:hypothetical protein
MADYCKIPDVDGDDEHHKPDAAKERRGVMYIPSPGSLESR